MRCNNTFIRLGYRVPIVIFYSFTCALRRLRAYILTRCKIWIIKNNTNNNNINIIMFVLSQ
jgi:hypothetical protein